MSTHPKKPCYFMRKDMPKDSSFFSKQNYIWPTISLLTLTAVYRFVIGWMSLHHTDFQGLLAWMPNFYPFAAIAICGGVFFSKRIHFIGLILTIIVTDYVINSLYHIPFFTAEIGARYLCLILLLALSLKLRPLILKNQALSYGNLIATLLAGSVLFYVITNSISWLYPGPFPTSTVYSFSFSGWIQALTIGLPGFPPSWVFFRNAVISDFTYAAALVFCLQPNTQFSKALIPIKDKA